MVFNRTGSPVTQAARTPILTIPGETEGWADFKLGLKALFAAQGTHIYIDTSFLMWMTKIGSSSRRELIGWLQQNCPGRVHVPIWAAHEYLKHHVATVRAIGMHPKRTRAHHVFDAGDGVLLRMVVGDTQSPDPGRIIDGRVLGATQTPTGRVRQRQERHVQLHVVPRHWLRVAVGVHGPPTDPIRESLEPVVTQGAIHGGTPMASPRGRRSTMEHRFDSARGRSGQAQCGHKEDRL